MSQARLLKCCLKDDALRSVAYLRETAGDFELMVKTLKGRYDQPNTVLEIYVTEIHQLKPALRPAGRGGAKKVYDQAFSLFQTVKRYGMDINQVTLKQTLMAKLSSKARDFVIQSFRGVAPEAQNTEKVFESLNMMVCELEEAALLTEISQKHIKTGNTRPHQTYAQPTQRSYATEMEQWDEEGEDCTETVNAVVAQRSSGTWQGPRYQANKPRRGHDGPRASTATDLTETTGQ